MVSFELFSNKNFCCKDIHKCKLNIAILEFKITLIISNTYTLKLNNADIRFS